MQAPCTSITCQNGGTCSNINTSPYFNCSCSFGYTGDNCQIRTFFDDLGFSIQNY